MTIAQGQLIISVITVILGMGAALIAWRSFLRTERWKQAEFLAGVMKDFAVDQHTQKALLMVDWGLRSIPLLKETAPDKGLVTVSREMQARALRPHTFMPSNDATTFSTTLSSDASGFSDEEAAIRDCYDALLDRLERLGNYVKTKLITVSNLEPYIGYWIDDIYKKSTNDEDATWRATLLVYIDFYRFKGVQYLFSRFDKPIGPASEALKIALNDVKDRTVANNLLEVVLSKGTSSG